MATQQDIARVTLELHDAQAAVEKMRAKRFFSFEAGGAYSAAKLRIELAEEELAELTAEWEAEQEALANRPGVEKSVAKDIDAAEKQLEASRKKLTEAATRAQQALVDVGLAAEAHNALIAQQSAALAVRGLRFEDKHDHQTGANQAGVRIRGAWWLPVDSSTLLVWVMHRAATAFLPSRHRLIEALKYGYGRHLLDRRGDRPLAGVPDLPQRVHVRGLRPEPVDLRGPSYIKSRQVAEEQIRRQLTGYTRPILGDDGLLYAEACEAPEGVKQVVEQEIQTLRENIKSGRIVAKYP
ncbi:hypothetical protein ACFVX6_26930 [Streptomyces sp. NPDC058289]|uniref:hypothetical protein n=1 Tax=Streptomyces sp. NPDC058289 TaxID=3346425 RepID=UPI0036E46D95